MQLSSFESLESRKLFASFLDTSFGAGGVQTVKFKQPTGDPQISLAQIATDSVGRTYVLGRTNGTAQIRRLTASGALDTTWFPSKHSLLLFQYSSSINSLKIQIDSNDRLLLLNGKDVYRFTAAGALDSTFGKAGTLTLGDFKSNIDISVDASDRLYATGSTKDTKTFLVERFISRGRFDSGFDADGRFAVALPTVATAVQGNLVRVLSTGKVMVAGRMESNNHNTGSIATRLSAGGTTDTTYGNSGITFQQGLTFSDLGSGFITPHLIRADGSVSLTGSDNTGGSSTLWTKRILKDGGVDDVDYAVDASALEPDGGLLETWSRVVTRVRPNMSTESTFNGGTALAGVDALDLLDDDSVLVASISSRYSGRISVAKYLPSVDPANV